MSLPLDKYSPSFYDERMGKWLVYLIIPIVVFLGMLYFLGVIPNPRGNSLPGVSRSGSIPLDISNPAVTRITVTYEGNIEDVDPGDGSVILITDIPEQAEFIVTGETEISYEDPSGKITALPRSYLETGQRVEIAVTYTVSDKQTSVRRVRVISPPPALSSPTVTPAQAPAE